MTIIDKINTSAASLTETDLNQWVIPELMQFYQNKINGISYKIYNSSNEVSSSSFKEIAKKELSAALNTFLFKAEHWRSGRDINPYLITTISRLGTKVKSELNAVKHSNALICPLCKENKNKELLIQEGKLWKCAVCSNLVETLNNFDAKLALYKIFALHSRKGYRCPECDKFLPSSYLTEETIMCPYIGCSFIGYKLELSIMSHPVSSISKHNLSLQSLIPSKSSSSSSVSYQDMLKDDTHIDTDTRIYVEENFNLEYKMLLSIIENQIEHIPSSKFQKLLMMRAFKMITKIS